MLVDNAFRDGMQAGVYAAMVETPIAPFVCTMSATLVPARHSTRMRP